MQRIWVTQTAQKTEQQVLLKGWVHNHRDHGKVLFVDLRDRSGLVQLVFQHDQHEALYQQARKLGNEDVIEVLGKVVGRDAKLVNAKLATGAIEVVVESVKILSQCAKLPIEINQENLQFAEELRLKYRYLDLRRPHMQRKMMLRSQMVNLCREYLLQNEFIDIETPMLTKSTPEGSRDFVVPSRFYKGKFYALPQSPQQYKQLLMVAGYERYFQVARCIRDEDLRADRGFEFSQLDLEMSFVEQADVMSLIEAMVIKVVDTIGGKTIRQRPFPVVDYQDALKQYGADKFDMREDPKHPDELAFAWVVNFPTFVRDEETKGWTYSHNPFTGPQPELLETLRSIDVQNLKDPAEIAKIQNLTSTQYDLVCNGFEIGGGGIRIHDPELLSKVFEIIGHSPAKIREQFGHMLDAFQYGVPPHGGIALGLDRFAMLLTGDTSLKEVIPFPMTSSGHTAVMDAPADVTEAQLVELGLSIRSSAKRSVFKDICTMLDDRHIVYKKFEHEAVLTSEDAARVRGTQLASGAKALLVKAGNDFHMVVLSAQEKLDSKKLRDTLGVAKTRFATPEEVLQTTGCELGAVPPFGDIFNVKLWVDKSLSRQTTVDFNAGERTRSIEMSYSDYEKLVKAPIVEVTVTA